MDLFLILHKVRGEPAFDVAQQVQIGSEVGWIIPTSGHRAYPAAWWELTGLKWYDIDILTSAQRIGLDHLTGVPDHYTVTSAPRVKIDLDDLLEGLGAKLTSLTRRGLT